MKFRICSMDGLLQDSPEDYAFDEELQGAVEAAIALKRPLIVAGEPGTGKTTLARAVAHHLHAQSPKVFLQNVWQFDTQSASTANDLLYRYDALGHFHEASIRKDAELKASQYVGLEALGIAFALTKPQKYAALLAKTTQFSKELAALWKQDLAPVRSVVLIDEIDKAPRDFPNDLLNTIDRYQFRIKETGELVEADATLAPLVILTSNSEKNLPDAFLRRCLFYHIPFPSKEKLLQIAQARIPAMKKIPKESMDAAVALFLDLRNKATRKRPATAEMLLWLHLLLDEGFFNDNFDGQNLTAAQQSALTYALSALAKTKEDRDAMGERYVDRPMKKGG